MIDFDDISNSVDLCLKRDGKAPDDNQFMQSSPYGFDNTFLMRDFLLDVSHELQKIGIVFNVDDLDIAACMSMTVANVKLAIFADLTP